MRFQKTALNELPGNDVVVPGQHNNDVVALVLILLIVAALRLIPIPSFTFAFNDGGANLTVQYLMSRGLVPSVDFGYHYGLLPLLMGKLWFWLFGLSARL